MKPLSDETAGRDETAADGVTKPPCEDSKGISREFHGRLQQKGRREALGAPSGRANPRSRGSETAWRVKPLQHLCEFVSRVGT